MDKTASDNTSILVGVVSNGIGCGLANYPGLYSRVSTYTSWIKSIIGPEPTRNLFTWGNDAYTSPAAATHLTPAPNLVGIDWTSVSTADGTACGIDRIAFVWCWGANFGGAAGTGDALPVPIPKPASSGVTSVTVGSTFACGLRSTKAVECWGTYGTRAGAGASMQIGGATDWAQISAGASQLCATRANGRLYCGFGNGSGQLGLGDIQTRPGMVRVGTSTTWASVSAGGSHSCGVQTNGSLWCWGNNSTGQLGRGDTTSPQLTPIQIGAVTTWASVSASTSNTCATRTDGSLWCWGANDVGQVGDGTTTQRTAPVRVGAANDWSSVQRRCAVKADATVWCWGANDVGQIGDGTTTNRLSPVMLEMPNDWKAICAGLIGL